MKPHDTLAPDARIFARGHLLFWIENVDEVAFHVEQTELENCKQADRPGTDNDNVSLDRLTHSRLLARRCFGGICLMWRSV